MPVTANLAKAHFRVEGPDFTPSGREWDALHARDRQKYWKHAGFLAERLKHRELMMGMGVDGRPLPPRKRMRRDFAEGPVLVPHWTDSRFTTQLRYVANATGATLYWAAPWGRIVGYHARGEVRGAPVRNVIGLTRGSQEILSRQLAKRWNERASWIGAAGLLGMGGEMLTAEPGKYRVRPFVAGTWAYDYVKQEMARGAASPLSWAPNRPSPIVPSRAVYGSPTKLSQVPQAMELAGRGQMSQTQIKRFVQQVSNTSTLADMKQALVQLGVMAEVYSKRQAAMMLERNLQERNREAG
jgi:hypothetical protein